MRQRALSSAMAPEPAITPPGNPASCKSSTRSRRSITCRPEGRAPGACAGRYRRAAREKPAAKTAGCEDGRLRRRPVTRLRRSCRLAQCALEDLAGLPALDEISPVEDHRRYRMDAIAQIQLLALANLRRVLGGCQNLARALAIE